MTTLSEANELFRSGHYQMAAKAFRKLSKIQPDNINVLISRAICEHKLGNLMAACHLLKSTLDKEPHNDKAVYNYAWLRLKKRDYHEARDLFSRLPQGSTYYQRALTPLAESLVGLGDLETAKKINLAVQEVDPSTAAFLDGRIAERENRYEAADVAYGRAVALGHGLEAQSARAYALLARGEREEALALWDRCHSEKRQQFRDRLLSHQSYILGRSKLEDDLDQARHVMQYGDGELSAIRAYADLLERTLLSMGFDNTVEVSGSLLQQFARFLNQPLHKPVLAAPCVANLVSRQLNWGEINRELMRSKQGMVVVDNLLEEGCLRDVQRFCTQHMIWYYDRAEKGYTGAYFDDGLCSERLVAVAEELRRALGPVLKQDALSKVWAFRYNRDTMGISPHADFSRWTVNLWICPDEGNLDPTSGGLRIYDLCAPPGRGSPRQGISRGSRSIWKNRHAVRSTRLSRTTVFRPSISAPRLISSSMLVWALDFFTRQLGASTIGSRDGDRR